MEDMKLIIAKNIATLRQAAQMTQSELAVQLNYSDKAISKWERGESIPDVIVLKTIADLFGVTVDYLLQADHTTVVHQETPLQRTNRKIRNRKVITTLSILIVWFVATFAFVVLDVIYPGVLATGLSFVAAVPVTMVVWLVFNTIWFDRRWNYWIISALMWSALVTVFLSAVAGGYPLWKMFLLGVPGQIAIYVWSRFQLKSSKS